MVTEEKVNAPPLPDPHLNRKATPASLAQHALELSELQLQLLVADLKAATSLTRTAVTLAVVAVVLLIAAAPVLLLSAAAALQEAFELGRAVSLLIAGAAAVLTAGILLYAGWKILLRGAGKFGRSRDELKYNIEWVKQAVRPHATPPPEPMVRRPK